MMPKLNLFPTDEIKATNEKHIKKLKLLATIFAFMLAMASIVVTAKLCSLYAKEEELTKCVQDLTNFEAHQKKTLDDLHKKQAKIATHVARGGNNVDVAQFLHLLTHLNAKNAVIYEVKARANQISFVGFSNNRTSVIELTEQLKRSSHVQEISNFTVTKASRETEETRKSKYPLSFTIMVIMKKGSASK